ncbi:MAG: type II secretory pathway pseudopilin PulG [Cognaticolwellia sp.]|jgi:type II secretory pathway pseudopilin PulG
MMRYWSNPMNTSQTQHYNHLYEQHLINFYLQGKRPSTIDAYTRAVCRITTFFDKAPDTLTTTDLKQYFNSLIQPHSWSTIKLDRNGLQFLTAIRSINNASGFLSSSLYKSGASQIF